MRHTTRPLPGYGTLTLEIWNDGTDVQVIGPTEKVTSCSPAREP